MGFILNLLRTHRDTDTTEISETKRGLSTLLKNSIFLCTPLILLDQKVSAIDEYTFIVIMFSIANELYFKPVNILLTYFYYRFLFKVAQGTSPISPQNPSTKDFML